jgi:hypothetical protein
MSKSKISTINIPEELRHQGVEFTESWLNYGQTTLPNIFLFNSNLSSHAKILFAYLFECDQVNETFPTIEELEQVMGKTKPQIIKYRKELEKFGILKTIRTGRENHYEIDFGVLK